MLIFFPRVFLIFFKNGMDFTICKVLNSWSPSKSFMWSFAFLKIKYRLYFKNEGEYNTMNTITFIPYLFLF